MGLMTFEAFAVAQVERIRRPRNVHALGRRRPGLDEDSQDWRGDNRETRIVGVAFRGGHLPTRGL